MQGLSIFLHSLRQVVGNLTMAIRISWWFVVVLAAGAYVLYGMVFSNPAYPKFESDAATVTFLLLVFSIWSVSLISVVWHRYILLSEIPNGIIPYRKGLKILTYFWFGIGIAIILIVLLLVMSLVLGMFIRPSTMTGFLILNLIIGMVLAVLFYRLALILPAVALGQKLTLGDAMQATRSAIPAILGLAVITVLFNMSLTYLVDLAFGIEAGDAIVTVGQTRLIISPIDAGDVAYVIVRAAVQWFSLMLSVSILSTLYGHYVEKRTLS